MALVTQLALNSLVAGATYVLIALGFNLIYGATKFINFAHGAFAAIGGYTVFFLAKVNGLDLWVSIVIGVVVAGLFGYASDRIVFRSLRRRKASSLVLFLASLGLFTVLQALLAMLFSSQFQTLVSEVPVLYHLAGGAITRFQLIIAIAAAIAFGGLLAVLRCTMFGKAVRAVSDDEEVAKIIGIDTDRIIGYVFFVGSALAGLAGILIGLDIGLRPTMGLLVILEGAIASIIGGIGNIYGGVIGSFILGFAENFGIWKIGSEWKAAVTFGILVVFLVLRPQGIFKR